MDRVAVYPLVSTEGNMTKIFIMTVLLSLTIPAFARNDSNRIEPGQAGLIRIGMPTTKITKLYRDAKIKKVLFEDEEGNPLEAFEVFLNPNFSKSLTYEPSETKPTTISRMIVFDPAFKTKKGIGVGSSFSDLLKVYTPAQIFGDDPNGPHLGALFDVNGVIVYVKGEGKVGFILNYQKMIPTLEPEDVPKTSIIKAIYIY